MKGLAFSTFTPITRPRRKNSPRPFGFSQSINAVGWLLYFVTVTRKLGVDPELAQKKVELFTRGRVVRFESSDVVAAIELHRLTRISFWDAMIVHAARLAGAAVLYSEDLQHGSSLGGISILNPF
jgi:predicted nucleic acid-binding protein